MVKIASQDHKGENLLKKPGSWVASPRRGASPRELNTCFNLHDHIKDRGLEQSLFTEMDGYTTPDPLPKNVNVGNIPPKVVRKKHVLVRPLNLQQTTLNFTAQTDTQVQ